ncbi:MAG: 3-oxoacyl-(acyl-carrier-protein) synthase 2 [Syntrophus sp. PtaU1.Bin208]|nr:MAG: 3-oxoacyl-(acyl-carrier-protein) synthase 2 [Syntrophus sp. PtaU1.Bin208]
MTPKRIFVTGMGMISPLGADVPNSLQALHGSNSGLKPLTRFPAPCLLPVGEIQAGTLPPEPIPATHQYALAAAFEVFRTCTSK